MGVREDATTVLLYLANKEQFPGDSQKGRYSLTGGDIQKGTGLDPEQINDAVDILEEAAYVDVRKWLGTAPFRFGEVDLTARGRVEAESVQQATGSAPTFTAQPQVGGATAVSIQTAVTPSGSPYGFTDQDWASVAVDRNDGTRLIVCFGYQWKSTFYSTTQLETNVENMFSRALGDVTRKMQVGVALDFRKLQGGYGTHLFNEITRDIIGSDIAVFDAGDQNANVMIELGVALTWGIRVLPIRDEKAPKPPSDISGQTWAEYSGSGTTWKDQNHQKKVEKMIEFAIKRKVQRP